jgi:hypothetical protein
MKRDPDELRLQLQSFEPGHVTVSARVPRLPPGADGFDIESSARRCIGSLIRRLREAGGDPAHITRTRLCVSQGAHGAVLAAVRDEALRDARAVHSIFFLDEGADDVFTAELDGPARHA